MLRTNLSTRPFYNERLVHLALGLAALIVLVVTALNLVQVVRLSRENTKLSARIREDRAAADEYGRKARQTRQNINQEELKLVVAAAREANTLIDSRTFSWTQFFNHIESTLPPDVMLASVRPTIEEDAPTKVTMVVLARRWQDLDEFMNKLEATGAFEKPLSRQIVPNEDGLQEGSVEVLYVPETPSPPGSSPAPAASTGPPAPAPAKPPAPATPGKGGSR